MRAVIEMTLSMTNPRPVSASPATFLQRLRSAAAEGASFLHRAVQTAKQLAGTVARRLRAAASNAVPESEPQSTDVGLVIGARPIVFTAQATSGAGAVRIARILSAAVAVGMAVASAAGLWWKALYQDPASATAMFRGYDLVSLAVATPVLVGALVLARRRSPRAHLIWAGMLAYVFYTYAYYVFGAAFNALFLVHVAVFVLSIVALVLTLANLDVPGIAEKFDERTPVRLVSGLLAFLAAALGGMWTYHSLRFALTGASPPEGLLVQPPSVLHLGYAMDLAVLVPGYAAAALLLWKRRPWGYVLATVLLTSSSVVQLDYMVALLFQAATKVPGATAFDPQEPFIAAAILAASAALLANVGRTRQASTGPRNLVHLLVRPTSS